MHGPEAHQRYRDLYSETRWETLARMFSAEYFSLHGLATDAPFLSALTVGLSALKTYSCVPVPRSAASSATDTDSPSPMQTNSSSAPSAPRSAGADAAALSSAAAPSSFAPGAPSQLAPSTSASRPLSALAPSFTPASLRSRSAGAADAALSASPAGATSSNSSASSASVVTAAAAAAAASASAAAAAAAAAAADERAAAFDAGRNPNCPLCREPFHVLARSLPHAHYTHSSLVCRITGAVMDDDNPPMVLPNGNAYSRRAIEAAVAASGNGRFSDPLTGAVFPMSEIRRAFVAN